MHEPNFSVQLSSRSVIQRIDNSATVNCMASFYSPAILLVAAVVAGVHGYIGSYWTAVEQVEDVEFHIPEHTHGLLNVYVLPVGQGDCTIIQCPNGNIVVVDCGSSGGLGLNPEQIESILQSQIDKVAAIVITHPDSNHFNFIDKIEWIPSSIRRVIINGDLDDYDGVTQDSIHIYKWLQKLNMAGKLYKVNNGQKCIGDCTVPKGIDFCENKKISFNILAADVKHGITMKLSVDNWSILLPGSIDEKAAKVISDKVKDQLHAVVYKIADHGQANEPFWLKQVNPEMAFTSGNYDNQQYPKCETVGHLMKLMDKTAPPHPFQCGRSVNKDKEQDCDYEYNIYETSPAQNMICALMYSSSGQQYSDCYQIKRNTVYEKSSDDELQQEELIDDDTKFLQSTADDTQEVYYNDKECTPIEKQCDIHKASFGEEVIHGEQKFLYEDPVAIDKERVPQGEHLELREELDEEEEFTCAPAVTEDLLDNDWDHGLDVEPSELYEGFDDDEWQQDELKCVYEDLADDEDWQEEKPIRCTHRDLLADDEDLLQEYLGVFEADDDEEFMPENFFNEIEDEDEWLQEMTIDEYGESISNDEKEIQEEDEITSSKKWLQMGQGNTHKTPDHKELLQRQTKMTENIHKERQNVQTHIYGQNMEQHVFGQHVRSPTSKKSGIQSEDDDQLFKSKCPPCICQ